MKHRLVLLSLITILPAIACSGTSPESTPTSTVATANTASLSPTPEPRATSTPIPGMGIGSTMVSPVDGMELVYVPEGTFLMGSDSSDPQAKDDESPQHEVYLDAYWIDRTEVTNAMFAAFLNEQGNRDRDGEELLDADSESAQIHERGGVWEAYAGFEDHPVYEVSWYGARAYCEWAGRRLPTEAEWEKAARGTDGQLYPWGDTPPTCSLAQYTGCSGRTTAVGGRPDGRSPYGALDMAGNLAEWVADWYDADYYETSPGENPLGPVTGEVRVHRGGPWFSEPENLRAAIRGRNYPYIAAGIFGFRCSLSP